MEMEVGMKMENGNTLQMSMKMSPNERGPSISLSKILYLRVGLMEFFKFEKKKWRYLSSKFLPNKKKECQNLDIF